MELVRVDLLRSRLHLSEPLDLCELGDYFGHRWAFIGALSPAPLYDVPGTVRETPSQRRMWGPVRSLALLVLFMHIPVRYNAVKRNTICEYL